MKDINKAISKAETKITAACEEVTKTLREILIQGGIPASIAYLYSACQNHGGEWLLDKEDTELLCEDIHLLDNKYIISVVKELENL